MAKRRNVVLVGLALVVLLVVGVVAWRLGGDDDDGDVAVPPVTGDRPAPDGTQQPSDTPAGTAPPETTTTSVATEPVPEPALPATRDARTWPFAWNSIWNLPLGHDARRVPAGMYLPDDGVTADEDILILEPGAPRVDVIGHDGGWDAQVQRCDEVNGETLLQDVPIPDGFVTDPGFLGATPNHSSAILLADGDTLVQTQPLHRCEAGGDAVSQYVFGQDSLHNGTGIPGAHGGSKMSSLGGTLRLGELVPGGAIRHALKVNIDCFAFCSYDPGDADGQPGFRWPAVAADNEAPERYQGDVAALQMGALLALPADFDADALQTEPGRMVARAMVRYGAYVVDDTRYPVFALTTEWSPQGRVIDEFEQAWGFKMHDAPNTSCNDGSAGCAWAHDMSRIVEALQVIDDNGPSSIGGGGTRTGPCAPAFADGWGGAADCATA